MTGGELVDLLVGLYAYDTGSHDSGIHDEDRKRQCIAYLDGLNAADERIILGWIVREAFLTDTALAQQYGLEDALHFLLWLRSQLHGDHVWADALRG